MNLSILTFSLSRQRIGLLGLPGVHNVRLALSAAILIFATVLSGCTTTPNQPKERKPMIPSITDTNTPQERQEYLRELQDTIKEARYDKDWEQLIAKAHTLWTEVSADDQAVIEWYVWHALKTVPEEKIKNWVSGDNPDLEAWANLVQTTRLPPIYQTQALHDLNTLYPNAFFNAHLKDALILRLQHPSPIRKIAIFLPMQGNYSKIAAQIRNGMIRNQLANAPTTELLFYDSSQAEQMPVLYQQAKKAGAEVLLGPLQKEAIESLKDIQDPNLIVLNASEQFENFSFRSDSEAWQIVQQFCRQGYHRLAILTSSQSSDTKLAQQVTALWLQQNRGSVELKSYASDSNNLRKALGSVINESESESRKNNLQWLLRETLQFEPRTRKDLQTILLLGNSRQIAVFKPQFDFFDLKIPVYSSSKVTPIELVEKQPNRDIAKVIFPSFPAALHPSDLTSTLEAYGWDAFTLATHRQFLGPNVCLNFGQTGRLFVDHRHYDRIFQWAQFNAYGRPEPLNADALDPPESYDQLVEDALDGPPQ